MIEEERKKGEKKEQKLIELKENLMVEQKMY